MKFRGIALGLAMIVVTTGCKTTNETVGAVVGGIGGAAASYGITSAVGGNSAAAAVAAVGGGLAGAYLGSEIGRRLDEADRQKAETASAKAVTSGKTGQAVQWQSDKDPNVYGRTKVVDTGTISNDKDGQPAVTWQRSQRREPIKTDTETTSTKTTGTAAQPTAPTPATPTPQPATTPPPQAQPTQTATVEPADDKTCKKVDEVAYINGKETRQQRVFCQTASGGWAPVTV